MKNTFTKITLALGLIALPATSDAKFASTNDIKPLAVIASFPAAVYFFTQTAPGMKSVELLKEHKYELCVGILVCLAVKSLLGPNRRLAAAALPLEDGSSSREHMEEPSILHNWFIHPVNATAGALLSALGEGVKGAKIMEDTVKLTNPA